MLGKRYTEHLTGRAAHIYEDRLFGNIKERLGRRSVGRHARVKEVLLPTLRTIIRASPLSGRMLSASCDPVAPRSSCNYAPKLPGNPSKLPDNQARGARAESKTAVRGRTPAPSEASSGVICLALNTINELRLDSIL